MQVITLAVIAIVARVPLAMQPAQGAVDSKPQGFFARNEVAFWNGPRAAPADSNGTTVSLWAEPMRMPDGRMTVYVPPRPVLDFLESPTRETAKEYLAWQSERARKLKAAIELLREVRAEARGTADDAPAPVVATPATKGPAPVKTAEILYFKKPDCGYCEKEDEELAHLASEGSTVPVTVVPPDDPRWKEFGITATPSFVMTRSDGTRTLVRGFLPAAQLKKLIEEANRANR